VKTIKYDAGRTKTDKEKATALRAKMLTLPKAMPVLTPEEMKTRRRMNCDSSSDGSAQAMAQSSNDFLAEFPD
jgi:hypothetical protein